MRQLSALILRVGSLQSTQHPRERAMGAISPDDRSVPPLPGTTGGEDETLRCFECRRLWPRTAMRWGTRPAGPVWFPRIIRVLRCPDCLPG